jgi:hypothetical protein
MYFFSQKMISKRNQNVTNCARVFNDKTKLFLFQKKFGNRPEQKLLDQIFLVLIKNISFWSRILFQKLIYSIFFGTKAAKRKLSFLKECWLDIASDISLCMSQRRTRFPLCCPCPYSVHMIKKALLSCVLSYVPYVCVSLVLGGLYWWTEKHKKYITFIIVKDDYVLVFLGYGYSGVQGHHQHSQEELSILASH